MSTETEGPKAAGRNPAYGIWGWPTAWGDTAQKARTHRTLPTAEPTRHPGCPSCGSLVRWETDFHGGAVVRDADDRVHVCDQHQALVHCQHRDGAEIMQTLRRVINERRSYGEAV